MATIGLFALAIVVVALAFAIQQLVGGDGDDDDSAGGPVETAVALNRTRTAQAGEPTQATTQTPTTQQPGGTRTPGASTTPGTRTPTTGTPGAGGETYVVQDGDFCSTIAEDFDITLQELLDANDMTEADCNNLQIGQELNIP